MSWRPDLWLASCLARLTRQGEEPMRFRDKIGRLMLLARAALAWERLWPVLWPMLAVLAAFFAVALFDLLPKLPGWLHVAVLLGFLGGLVVAGRPLVRAMRPIGEQEVLHRLETDNALRHRPLVAVDDRLAAGGTDPAAVALWNLHRRRMARLARDLVVRLPRPGVPRRDPMAVRAAVLLVLVVALVAGSGDWGGRLERALSPTLGAPTKPIGLEVWITPPAYTRLAPLFLDRTAQQTPQPLKLPKGSTLLAQVSGSKAAPSLKIGDAKTPFEAIGPGDHRVEATLDGGNRLSVELSGRTLAAWPLEMITDQPPQVSFQRPPETTGRTQIRIDYQATDDYGLAKVVAEMRRVGDPNTESKPGIEIDLPLPGLGAANVKGRLTRDLTPHLWAGLPVRVRLVATDVGGLTGQSEDLELILPEREFRNPVAQILIRHRKLLVDPTEEAIDKVDEALDRLLASPELYSRDTATFLGLRVARTRLEQAPDEKAIDSVQQMMWDMALRLEEGQAELAQKELQKLRDQVQQALRDQSRDPEIEKLMDELRRALDSYMDALIDKLQNMTPFDGQMPPNARDLTEEMRKLLEKAQELAQQGDKEGAERLVEQLRQMLENLQNQIARGDPNSPQGRAAAQARAQAQRAIHGLQALTKKQQGLIDRTFRQSNRIDQPPRGMRSGVQEAIEQEEMRRTLGDLMLEFHEVFDGIPGNIGQAERGMRDSTESLITGNLGQALKDQAEVLMEMRKSANDAQQQMAQQFGGVMVGRLGPGGRDPGRGPGDFAGRDPRGPRDGVERDPFGREQQDVQNSGDNVDGPIELPEQMESRRSQEILEELRRRSADRSRPPSELNYIERLLKQF